jgi:hypothetical protein
MQFGVGVLCHMLCLYCDGDTWLLLVSTLMVIVSCPVCWAVSFLLPNALSPRATARDARGPKGSLRAPRCLEKSTQSVPGTNV